VAASERSQLPPLPAFSAGGQCCAAIAQRQRFCSPGAGEDDGGAVCVCTLQFQEQAAAEQLPLHMHQFVWGQVKIL